MGIGFLQINTSFSPNKSLRLKTEISTAKKKKKKKLLSEHALKE